MYISCSLPFASLSLLLSIPISIHNFMVLCSSFGMEILPSASTMAQPQTETTTAAATGFQPDQLPGQTAAVVPTAPPTQGNGVDPALGPPASVGSDLVRIQTRTQGGGSSFVPP